MLWPFNLFRSSGPLPQGTIGAIYGMIVAQAREPAFYSRYNVPDTVNGRLDMLILHLWLMLRRLRSEKDGGAVTQALFDHFCTDMDANLREMGVGDLTVPKRMKTFGEAFYGRTAAYDLAMTEGPEALAASLSKNILNGEFSGDARRLADYVFDAEHRLGAAGRDLIDAGERAFPKPPEN